MVQKLHAKVKKNGHDKLIGGDTLPLDSDKRIGGDALPVDSTIQGSPVCMTDQMLCVGWCSNTLHAP
jgi:hypothetical protein